MREAEAEEGKTGVVILWLPPWEFQSKSNYKTNRHAFGYNANKTLAHSSAWPYSTHEVLDVSVQAPTRHLIVIPIIHSETDLGSMCESIRKMHLHRHGSDQWERRVKTVEQLWQDLKERIEGLRLDYSHVRLYQDGLPNCGREIDIVRDLAKAGSINHQILLSAMERGAALTGTESPKLLLEEYELAKQVMAMLGSRRSGEVVSRQQLLGKQLLEKRDQYIADRIAGTLKPGETGLLFLGLLHAVENRLPPEIQVSRLSI